MPFTESSITLDFPDGSYFRLCECDGYRDIMNNFAEMDACWYDQVNDTLYLIELKDWENSELTEANDPKFPIEKLNELKKGISDYRIRNLVKKSVDTVCMFMSILLEKRDGLKIQQCAPFTISQNSTIKILSIINWSDPDLSYISHVNTAYRSKFSSYAKLFGIRTFLVIAKSKAVEQFNWVT